ncbi:MAG: ATP synthase F1 subunit delta [Candidatus Melainabacteria bacterium]|nr:ATP synthase F1 subunit delta [Candidatus Melainabacteria bacterium]
MKAKRQIARNYAQALLELIGNIQEKENILIQIREFNNALYQVKNASEVFYSPVVSKAEKKELVKKIFSKDITNSNKTLVNFIFLLIDNHRFSLLPEIEEEIDNLLDKLKGIVHAEVISAAPLKDEAVAIIKQTLEATLLKQNESLKVEQKTEPTLIGGLKVKVNDLVYDGSIKGRLEELKRRLG